MNNFNIFSKEFWEFKPNTEYIHTFSGHANISNDKNGYHKKLDSIPGLLFKEGWSFTITCIVEVNSSNFGFFTTKSKNYYKYTLNGLKCNETVWDLKVEGNGNGNISFSILKNQIMYSSNHDFTMKYTVLII
jgi:hypothetical protein